MLKIVATLVLVMAANAPGFAQMSGTDPLLTAGDNEYLQESVRLAQSELGRVGINRTDWHALYELEAGQSRTLPSRSRVPAFWWSPVTGIQASFVLRHTTEFCSTRLTASAGRAQRACIWMSGRPIVLRSRFTTVLKSPVNSRCWLVRATRKQSCRLSQQDLTPA